MATNVSALDLKSFHTLEINLHKRLVRNLRRGAELPARLIALWLWMESIGYYDLITNVSTFADSALESVVKEAEAALDFLGRDDPPTSGHNDMPVTAGLVNEPINLRFFHYNREVANNGINNTLHNVCDIIFAGSGERFSRAAVPQSLLNPFARAWAPGLESTSQDERSMFLTFSKGFPLTREEIVAFFTKNWGKCLERVMIERAPPGQQAPMFGRIVLTNASIIPIILYGQPKAKFIVNGKQLWARMYVPRRKN